MRFVDWKLYVSAAIAALAGVFFVVAAATKGLIPVLAIGTFVVLYLVFLVGELVWEQVRSRA